jgi:hypothetical protein
MRFPGFFLAAFAAGACAGSGSEGAAASATRRDSAGIQIVENSGPLWTDAKAWTVADSPLVDIGGVAGDPAYDFDQVNGVIRLSSGRLAVAITGTSQVRIYDAEGTHLATSGARGSGPGEYQAIAGFYPLAGDSVMVLDIMTRRLTVLDDSGKVGRTYSLGGETGFSMPGEGGRVQFAIPAGAFTDGAVLGVVQSFQINADRTGPYRDSTMYVVYGPDGVVRDSIGRFPGVEMEQIPLTFGPQSFKAPSPVPLGRNTMVAVERDQVILGTNDSWELQVRATDGTLRRLIRVAQAPRPVSPEQVAAHRVETRKLMENQPMMRTVPEQFRKQFYDRIEQAKYPETFPFIEGILAANDGTLWVHEQGNPGNERRVLAVFDSTGQLLGRVRLPDRFRPTHVTGDVIAGVWQDADDVEYVRVYQVRKPE